MCLIDMFRLWSLAEQDLLAENVSYRLRDTGQGLNRVQAAPKTFRMMHTILHRAQQSVGSWVGSSAIHMGDHNVPNALMFIGTFRRYGILCISFLRHALAQTNIPRFTGSYSPSVIPSHIYPASRINLRCAPTSRMTSVQ